MKLHKYGVLILLAVLSLTGFGQTPQLSRGQFLEDLAVLETKLKRHYPNLFTYQTPAMVSAHLASLRETTGEEVAHLIIDLRDNQGGDLQLGHYLLSYLLEESFQTVDHFARVKHPEATSDKLRLRSFNNRLSRKIKPRENRYQGKVYLLTNGGSFSNSGIFAWMIRKHRRGLILGSTPGGSPWQLDGGPNKNVRLPNSGIQVEIPTTRYALAPIHEKRDGVVPDRVILPTAADLAAGVDAVLNAVIDHISPTAQ